MVKHSTISGRWLATSVNQMKCFVAGQSIKQKNVKGTLKLKHNKYNDIAMFKKKHEKYHSKN